MTAERIRNISFAGAGNVAIHLAPALLGAGFRIRHIISHTASHAQSLAGITGAIASTDPCTLDNTTDLLILAIPDQSIGEFATELKKAGRFSGIVAHTSGTCPLSAISQHFSKAGVFYPLQTFSRFSAPEIRKVPVCIEANSPETETLLRQVAAAISGDVRVIDSERRALLHLSAVFVCNFPNHLYVIASRILKQSGIEEDILLPLIRETAMRLGDTDPLLLQTGPAVRGDLLTMQRHLQLLDGQPSFQKIYKILSESIEQFEQIKKSSDIL
ncbi:DUF2520 domain-containing protein [Lentimicrobium sp.]|uniref:Rossmann-like and DUF2520 domain-containing protein n=1 Tax=Lentimicrobium sp. TaxID=2034841 RepID=UPI002C3F18E5|nr:DUF2520 domain-containing protein [Lentimicrobium sp.]HPJ61774.1 DUF2520 domain-containing protein [Lentimicrobium sp.]HPR27049.1 DUF2520 domain-containing protein [Lentimicrobium sp.]